MALLRSDAYQPVGVIFFIPPAWRQGYYWREGMTDAVFFEHPKQLANDTVWFTNAHFDVTKNYGANIKQYRFFRIPMHRIVYELGMGPAPLPEQAARVGPFLARLSRTVEHSHLYHADNLQAAMLPLLGPLEPPDPLWLQLGKEARTWYWKGSVKHALLMGGSLYLPRYDFARQLIKCPVPDFSKPPKILKGEFKGLVLQNLLKDHVGFVRLRIENIHKEVLEFVDLASRTLFTSYEVLWLMQYADVTANYVYLAPPMPHPADDPPMLRNNFKPFSWLDGLRLEGIALAPAYKNIPMEAFLRGTAHVGVAHYAWYLGAKKGLAPIALSYGKIGVAFNRQEHSNIRMLARDSGLLFATAEEEGTDLAIGKGL